MTNFECSANSTVSVVPTTSVAAVTTAAATTASAVVTAGAGKAAHRVLDLAFRQPHSEPVYQAWIAGLSEGCRADVTTCHRGLRSGPEWHAAAG